MPANGFKMLGARMGRGFVLNVDYGHEAAELYNERHERGTALAYARHTVSEDLLRAPGEQDLDGAREFHGARFMGTAERAATDRLRDAAGISDGAGPRE